MEHVAVTIAAMLAVGGIFPVGHRSPLSHGLPTDISALIRSFQQIPAPFRPVERVAHAARGGAPYEAYEDDLGYVYRIDSARRILARVDRREDLHSTTRPARAETRLPVAFLRERAVAMVARQVPAFSRSRAEYHPLEANRHRELYLFRWEDCHDPLPESADAPYAEVALYADGLLARYADALVRRT